MDPLGTDHNDFFGFEIWRLTVWDSKTVRDLGCELLASLAHNDIYAEGEELVHLKRELQMMVENSTMTASVLKLDKDGLDYKVNYALEAIRIATDFSNVGVCIQ